METKHIGKEVSFDERSFKRTISAFDRHIAPKVADLSAAYEALGIGAFSSEIYDDIMNSNGIENAKKALTAQLNAELARLKITSPKLKENFLKDIPAMISTVTMAKDELLVSISTAQNDTGEALYNSKIYLDLAAFKIIDGEPVLDEDIVRKKATKFIETPVQSELYQRLLEVKEKHDQLLSYLNDQGIKFKDVWHCIDSGYGSNDGLFSLTDGGGISIKTDAPFYIDSKMRFKKELEHAEKRRLDDQARQQAQDEARRKEAMNTVYHNPIRNSPYNRR